jgi:hypothetical protein
VPDYSAIYVIKEDTATITWTLGDNARGLTMKSRAEFHFQDDAHLTATSRLWSRFTRTNRTSRVWRCLRVVR